MLDRRTLQPQTVSRGVMSIFAAPASMAPITLRAIVPAARFPLQTPCHLCYGNLIPVTATRRLVASPVSKGGCRNPSSDRSAWHWPGSDPHLNAKRNNAEEDCPTPTDAPDTSTPSKGFCKRPYRYGNVVLYSSVYRPISSNGIGLNPISHAGESSLRRRSPFLTSTKPGSVSIRVFPFNFSITSVSPK